MLERKERDRARQRGEEKEAEEKKKTEGGPTASERDGEIEREATVGGKYEDTWEESAERMSPRGGTDIC